MDRWHYDDTKYYSVAPGIHDSIMVRLTRLDPISSDLLGLLSVLGQSFSMDLGIMAISRYSKEIGRNLDIDHLNKLPMIRNVQSKIEFEHEIIQRSIYANLTESTRRDFHHLVASVIVDKYGKEGEHSLLSHHFFRAGDWFDSMVHSFEAAKETLLKGARREAAMYYERALNSSKRLPPDQTLHFNPEILEGLGDLYRCFGRFDASILLFEEAYQYAEENEVRARLLRKLGISWTNKDDFLHLDKAMNLLQESSEIQNVSEKERAEIMSCKAVLAFHQRDFEEAIACSVKARQWYDSSGTSDDVLWERVNLSIYYQHLGRNDLAWKELESSGVLIKEDTSREPLMEYYTQRTGLTLAKGDYPDCLQSIKISLELNDELGLYSNISYDHWLQGLVMSLNENHEKAIEEGLKAEKYAMYDELRRAIVRANTLLAHEYLMIGDLRAAESSLEKNSLLADDDGLSSMAIGTGLYWLVLAELHTIKGVHEMANEEASVAFGDHR